MFLRVCDTRGSMLIMSKQQLQGVEYFRHQQPGDAALVPSCYPSLFENGVVSVRIK